MKNKVLLTLILIILIGSILRFNDLGEENYWTDEAFSVHHANQNNFNTIAFYTSKTEVAPFGFYMVMHYWIKLFGNSQFNTRLFSAIFGILSILMFYLLVNKVSNKKVAIISALIMSVSLSQVLYSQEVRLYSLFTFLTLTLSYIFAIIYKSKNVNYLTGSSYVILLLACLYINYLAIFLVFLYTFILLFQNLFTKKLVIKWIVMHGIAFLVSIPLIPLAIAQFESIGSGASATYIKLGVPAFLAKLGLLMFSLPLVFLAIVLMLIFVFKDGILAWLKKLEISDNLFLIFIILFSLGFLYLVFNTFKPFGIPLFKSKIIHSYFLIRHSLFLIPIFYFIIAYKISKLSSRKIASVCLIILILANCVALSQYYNQTTKPEWKEATEFIAENMKNNPVVLLDGGGFSNTYLYDYYQKEKTRVIKLTWTSENREFYQVPDELLLKKLKDEKEVWLILAKNKKDHYKELLEKNYNLKEEKKFFGIEVYLFLSI